MNLLVLYLVLVKATLTSFTGFTSLPLIQKDLVEKRHWITDRQLNSAVAAARLGPGPNGLFIVGVGYYAAGYAGAFLGWLAVVTPAFLVLPLTKFLERHIENARLRSSIRSVTMAGAGLTVASSLPLARAAIHNPSTAIIAIAAVMALLLTELESLWVIAGAAVAGLLVTYIP